MTDEEMDKIVAKIEEAEEEVNKWWNSLSAEEKKKKKQRNQKTFGFGKIGRIVTL